MGDWQEYKTFQVKKGQKVDYEFPSAFQAYWIRFKTNADTTATAQLTYR